MNFSVEEENLICMYHTSDRRRTIARMLTGPAGYEHGNAAAGKRYHCKVGAHDRC
jgi:hypothetical protein